MGRNRNGWRDDQQRAKTQRARVTADVVRLRARELRRLERKLRRAA